MAYGHAQQPGNIMLQVEVLVCECFCAVYRSTACPVAIEEVSALDHEIFDLHAMRLNPHAGGCE